MLRFLYWKGRAGEIDFISGRNPLLIEVKHQERISTKDLKVLKKTGKGLLITKNTFGEMENVYAVPVRLFLPLTSPP